MKNPPRPKVISPTIIAASRGWWLVGWQNTPRGAWLALAYESGRGWIEVISCLNPRDGSTKTRTREVPYSVGLALVGSIGGTYRRSRGRRGMLYDAPLGVFFNSLMTELDRMEQRVAKLEGYLKELATPGPAADKEGP